MFIKNITHTYYNIKFRQFTTKQRTFYLLQHHIHNTLENEWIYWMNCVRRFKIILLFTHVKMVTHNATYILYGKEVIVHKFCYLLLFIFIYLFIYLLSCKKLTLSRDLAPNISLTPKKNNNYTYYTLYI